MNEKTLSDKSVNMNDTTLRMVYWEAKNASCFLRLITFYVTQYPPLEIFYEGKDLNINIWNVNKLHLPCAQNSTDCFVPFMVYACFPDNVSAISHFRVALCLLILKARLAGAQHVIWKWVFIDMQIKLISLGKVVHQASISSRGTKKLENGLLDVYKYTSNYLL